MRLAVRRSCATLISRKRPKIIVNASPVGLGAMLIQRDLKAGQGQVIAYASRSLTVSEKRYSQLEKEVLAIVFGIERFMTYIYDCSLHLSQTIDR